MRLLAQLDRDLQSQQHLSLAEFGVLSALLEGGAAGVRMTVLAERSMLSKSRLSHCVYRLEQDGFVKREPSHNDRRGLLAVLTDDGRERILAVESAHLASVRRYVIDVLSPEELVSMGGSADRIVDAIESAVGNESDA